MNFSLGLVEVSALGNAIIMLDEMLKVADVEFVATERKLGGRLVTIVVKGELTAVKASVDAGIASAKKNDCYKASQVIARPHEEILKFLHLDDEEAEPTSEIAGTHVGPVAKKAAVPKKEKAEVIAPAVEEAPKKPVKSKRRGRPKKSE
jgi:microcompartment protein CcmL/EutN